MIKKVVYLATVTSAVELQTESCSRFAHDVGKLTWTDLDGCTYIDCIYNGLAKGLAKLDIHPG